MVVADIPGLIEGASDGAGLGLRFLRHVERCRVLLHLVSLDPSEDEIHGDAISRFDKINKELRKFDPGLAERPQVVLLSKVDLVGPDRLESTREAFQTRDVPLLVASAVTGEGLDSVIHGVVAAMDASDADSPA
jgi:GTP-binding protein